MTATPPLIGRLHDAAEPTQPRGRRWLARLRRVLSDPIAVKGISSLVDQALVSGAGFATSVIVGRACGRTALGAYFLALTMMMFVKGLQDQLIAGPYMIYCSRRTEVAGERYAGSVLLHQVVITALAVMTLATVWVIGGDDSEWHAMLGMIVLVLPLYLFREFVRSVCFAQLKPFTAVGVDCLVTCLQIGGLVALMSCGLLTEQTALAVVGGACGLATTVWFLLRRQTFAPSAGECWSDWRHNWAFGRWALAGQLLSTSAQYAMPWILTILHGQVETGSYAASNTIVGFANLFVIGLSNFFCPRAAHAYADGGRPALLRFLGIAASTFLCVLGPITAVVFLAGDHSTALFFGSGYSGSGRIVSILMAAMLVNSFGIVAGNGLWAMEKPRANFASDACALTATLLATIMLVPLYGALGVAWAMLAGNTAGALVRGWTLRTLLREPPKVCEGDR